VEGTPYLLRLDRGLGKPEDPRLGVDFAGTVEAVGKSVTHFKPADEVFGGRLGALGTYVSIREDRVIVLKPANVSFEQAAAVPIAALTALHALRDKGHVRAGQKVLINAASGGIGSYAVQIAKSIGAEVTGVCSTRNLELVRLHARPLPKVEIEAWLREHNAKAGAAGEAPAARPPESALNII
jgi:NADPH:quinone reductase-like Zn-dependent oxidoreductase